MIDLQSEIIEGGIAINKVGVKNLRYPITVKDKALGFQNTVADLNMYVNLPKHFRGTHMSRFLEIISKISRSHIDRSLIRQILLTMKKKLDAQAAHIEIFFPYFVERTAPVSLSKSLMEYSCGLYGEHDCQNRFHLTLEINAMVLNLCPCSKELSTNTSAHNQRSRVTVKLQTGPMIWIEDVIDIIESSSSSPIYTLLKRVDEKYIMDQAFDRPRFVEDIVREIAGKLRTIDGLMWFSIASENYESIHNHNAYAYIESDHRRKDEVG